jgi:hypothetical protein
MIHDQVSDGAHPRITLRLRRRLQLDCGRMLAGPVAYCESLTIALALAHDVRDDLIT